MENLNELTLEECKQISGGVNGWAISAAIAAGIYLYDHRDKVVEGYTDVMKKVFN